MFSLPSVHHNDADAAAAAAAAMARDRSAASDVASKRATAAVVLN